MSIRDAEQARQRQQTQREKKRSKEAEARPDALHRAVIFLLHAAKENNPDLADEAKHHISSLDSELANPEKLAEIEPAAPKATDDEPEAEEPPKPDTASKIRQSRRFQRS